MVMFNSYQINGFRNDKLDIYMRFCADLFSY